MFSLMRGLGYEGFEMLVHRRFARNVLALEPIKDETAPHSEDVLWVVPGSAMAARIGV
jgi:hypothetical protein